MNSDYGYGELLRATRYCGYLVDSRYGPTREVIGLQGIFEAGLLVSRSGINRKIGWVEVVQLLAGVYELDAYRKVAPNANLDLFTPAMAYGPRIDHQLATAVELLKMEPASRQAVLFVGKPRDGMSNNQPCTQTIQFLLREGAVNTVVSMRSWDLIKGLPYDLMMFGALNHAVARSLSAMPGLLIIQAGSGHCYESDGHIEPRGDYGNFAFSRSLPRNVAGLRDWALGQLDPDDWVNGVPQGIEVVRCLR